MKERGTVVYVRSGEKVISLVPEVEMREAGSVLKPHAVYVIDAEGVRALRFRNRVFQWAPVLLAALAGPAQYLLMRGKRNARG